MTPALWKPTDALPERGTWLLEASAGTGKTFQIAGLFVRLVAEYGLPIGRILAITFTNAATAELRERIRNRLRQAHEQLSKPPPADELEKDPVLAHLRAGPDGERQLLRLELALREFDKAPISTIHSFSQRTLGELAFESKQDLELELLQSTKAIEEELVDDALAVLYASTNSHEIAVIQAAGYVRKTLLETAHMLSGASEPLVVPAVPDEPLSFLDSLKERTKRLAVTRALWEHDEAVGARAAMLKDRAFFKWKMGKDGHLEQVFAAFSEWLRADGPSLDTETFDDTLTAPALAHAWRKTAPTQTARPWWKLIEALALHFQAEQAFCASFAPVASFARSFRAKLDRRLERQRLLSFNGMLSKLAKSIEAEDEGAALLAERLRARYDAVFVDEFQDTDRAQWSVLKTAFQGHTRLFLIGDPKQAIYAFRGADVSVYLEAAKSLMDAPSEAFTGRFTMDQNWRSDPPAVAAMNALWQPNSGAFELAGVDYTKVSHNLPVRIEPAGAGFEVRWIDGRLKRAAPGTSIKTSGLRLTARLAAEEALAWLSGTHGKLLRETRIDGRESVQPSLPRPNDIAILVPGHSAASEVRRQLQRLRIPSVIASKNSVFKAPAAAWLRAWLDAVGADGRDNEARNAAVTPLFGWRADELAWSLAVATLGQQARDEATLRGGNLPNEAENAGDRRNWNEWTGRLRTASLRWSKEGFARIFDRELTVLAVLPRVLALRDGERHATDVRHLFERLHIEERTRRLGPSALSVWLREQADVEGDGTEQRLESDAEAVRVETVHVSKGLEYPIVLLPFLWHAKDRKVQDYEPVETRKGGTKVVDFSPPDTPARNEATTQANLEQRHELRRTLYVALTRARHRTIAWWGAVGKNGQQTNATPFGSLVMRAAGASGYPDSAIADFSSKGTADPWPMVQERLNNLQERSGGAFAWTEVEVTPAPPPREPEVSERTTAEWPAERALPSFSKRWGVTSYSALAKGAAATDHDEKLRTNDLGAPGAATPESDDEPSKRPQPRPAPATEESRRSPGDNHDEGASLGTLVMPEYQAIPELPRLTAGRGTLFGTFVHEVFENLDFTAESAREPNPIAPSDVAPRHRALIRDIGARHGFAPASKEVTDLSVCLANILLTPLGSTATTSPLLDLPADFTLGKLAKKDRLDELTFDLRLGAGSHYIRTAHTPEVPSAPLEARPGCVDPKKVYEALALEPLSAGLNGWLEHQKSREKQGISLIGSIAGILTGSIDLAFRVPCADSVRYFVADYKTNTIAGSAAGHYTGPWLDWKMATSGYVLQSLLYTLALHRHLTLRLGSERYRYCDHFGGALYLFVRGMGGPNTPACTRTGHRLGVHAHRWAPAVIHALDEALAPLENRRSANDEDRS